MSLKAKKVVVIDDDKGILQAVHTALEINGYNVVATSDEHYIGSPDFKESLPDIILLDMLLSGADGREICLKLKADKSTGHIPVIIFSAASNAKRSVLQAKADAFLPKPFSIKELVALIESLTGTPHSK